MEAEVEQMSRESLAREVQSLREAVRSFRSVGDAATARLLVDLQLQQAELEAQNRELRRAQQQLEDSRNKYAELYDFAPVGYCTLDLDGVIEEVNLTAAAMLGYDRGPLVGTPFAVAMPSADRAPFHTFLADCRHHDREASVEVTLAGRPGTPAPVQLVCTARRDSSRQATGYLMALMDIRQLKKLEARLRFLADVSELVGSRTDLQSALANVSRLAVPFLADLCFVDLLDETGGVSRLDVAFADVARQAELGEQVKAAGVNDSHCPQARVIASSQPRLYPALQQLGLEVGTQHPLSTTLMAAGIRSLMVVPLITRGRTLGALTFAASQRTYCHDDLAFAEEIARRAAMSLDNARLLALQQRDTRAREDLLAVVSHDLKSPLTVIMMTISSVLRGYAESNDRRRHGRRELGRIQRAAERMKVLINDLLDAASIEAGRFAVEAGRTQLERLIVDAVELFSPLAAAKSISLEVKCPDVPDVLADPARIQQVLANLIGNAIKFTPAEGRVTIGADPAGEFIRVWVQDTGPGIAPQDATAVFDRFWKARRGLRTGNGLGLFISQGIVAAHGGRIWVDPEAKKGSCFSFTLPRASAEAPLATIAPATEMLEEAMVKHAYTEGTELKPQEAVGRRPSRSWIDLDHLGLVAHELRGPATLVELQLDRLSSNRDGPLTVSQEKTVRRIGSAMTRLHTTIETVLQQAQLDYGVLRPAARPFDVLQEASGLADALRPLSERKGLTVRISCDREHTRRLESDPELVRLMLTHLLLNAIRRSPPGVVEVSVADRRVDWRLAVRDLGPVLSEEEQRRAFEPTEVTGLGLALVKDLALALGGQVEVASLKARGSTFAVTLPRLNHEGGRRS